MWFHSSFIMLVWSTDGVSLLWIACLFAACRVTGIVSLRVLLLPLPLTLVTVSCVL